MFYLFILINRRELEKQQAREAYIQRTIEGKTVFRLFTVLIIKQDQARADLERLAKIRAQREEAARRKKEEEEAKAIMQARIKEQAEKASQQKNANSRQKKRK